MNALRNHVARYEQPDDRINTEKLRRAEQIFISMFDNAEDGILIADVETKKILVGNKSICRMLGYSQDEIENLSIMEFHPSDRLPYVIEQFEKQARRELTLAKDIPLLRKDGSILYADINSFPIKRLGLPAEIGDLVVFLCSDRAAYITGASFDINGGDLMM